MFEHMTFDYIMNNMLNNIPEDIDKREGSVVYDCLAPCAEELAIMYTQLDYILDRAFADTATSDDLDRKAEERGVYRKSATKAIRTGEFIGTNNQVVDLPNGTRFSDGNLTYTIINKKNDTKYTLECEQAGTVGNFYFGDIYPIDYTPSLSVARLIDIDINGENEEDDDSLRNRFFNSINNQSFGGNKQDYKVKINSIQGVGGTRVIPHWQGAGTVKCIICDSNFNQPSDELVRQVQQIVDPNQDQQGDGIAPIGHIVTIEKCSNNNITISSTFSFEDGYNFNTLKPTIMNNIKKYFDLENENFYNDLDIIIRISRINSLLIDIEGVKDVTGTKINGSAGNLTLGYEQVAFLQEVVNV